MRKIVEEKRQKRLAQEGAGAAKEVEPHGKWVEPQEKRVEPRGKWVEPAAPPQIAQQYEATGSVREGGVSVLTLVCWWK